LNKIPPESSKNNPKHQRLDKYLEDRNLFDKAKDSIYNYIKKRLEIIVKFLKRIWKNIRAKMEDWWMNDLES
jgi:hypothetical protein